MRKKIRATAIAFVCSIPLGAAAPSTFVPAASAEPNCRASIDNPHKSKSLKLIISKARFKCDQYVTRRYVDVNITLYTGCKKPLPEKKPFTRFDCKKISSVSNLDITVKPGTIETRWIPEAGKPGHPNVAGYHRAYLEWEYPGSQKEYYAVSQQVSGVLK